MANVIVTDLLKVFGTPTGPQTVIDRINFEIADQSFVSLVGPSGCGKTTLLNIIAGIESASSGTVTIGTPGQQAKLAYVFQEPRLLPWRSIFDNLMYVQRVRDEAAKQRVHEALRRVGQGHAEKKWPGQLSGGQQQRVGIARALSIEPDVLLMDEPFSHLDAITARGLREHLQELWAQTRKTVVFVTHDVSGRRTVRSHPHAGPRRNHPRGHHRRSSATPPGIEYRSGRAGVVDSPPIRGTRVELAPTRRHPRHRLTSRP